MSPKFYWSDLHLDHGRIIEMCQRPFRSVEHMGIVLLEAARSVLDDSNAHLYTNGDVAFNLRRFSEQFRHIHQCFGNKEQNTLVGGNHDGLKTSSKHVYREIFGTIVGTEKTWRKNTLVVEDELNGQPVKLLLSHDPQRDLQGCDFNLYGHVHNDFLVSRPHRLTEECKWIADSQAVRFNVCVEVIGYQPRTFQEIWDMRHVQGLQLL